MFELSNFQKSRLGVITVARNSLVTSDGSLNCLKCEDNLLEILVLGFMIIFYKGITER